MRMSGCGSLVTSLIVFIVSTSAGAAPVRFDTPAEYEGLFNEVEGGGGTFSWSDGPGVGGAAGRIDVAPVPRASSTALYRVPFDLGTAAPHEVSVFFLAGAASATLADAAQLGLSPSATGGFSGGRPWVTVAVRSGAFRELDYGDRFGLAASYVADVNAMEDVDEATPPADAFALLSGHWYHLETEWEYGDGGGFRYAASLTDYGSDGLTPDASSVRSIAGSFLNSAFGDPGSVRSMFAGFHATASGAAPGAGGPTVAWDDFEARPVPEPAAPALAAAATASLLLRRRRR